LDSATDFLLRDCTEADIPAITAIYAHAVLTGFGTFEIDPPSEAEMANRWRAISERYPYFVAEMSGTIVGYAYASAYRPRPAYLNTVEDSVYVRDGFQGHGIGHRLLSRLIDATTTLGYRQMVAVIGDSANKGSVRLHEKCGFAHIGTMPSVGWKQGRWLDTVIMQRPLGLGDTSPAEPS
jgi:L-amino acid N-acyltransferase YncA